MVAMGVAALPADLFHLLADELSERLDFSTLYNCVVSSKQLAGAGAIAALYRISHQAPVKGGGEGLQREYLPLAEQELTVQRWSILWRTIVLSASGKTIYPYCKHLRFLDLRDLGELLEDDKFRGKIAKNFFTGELARFNFTMQTDKKKNRVPRLDTKKIITAIGDEITQHAPLLETLSEPIDTNIFSTALRTWAPRLENLKSLDFWDGNALSDETLRNLLHAHCPGLTSLRIYFAENEHADHHLAAFISGMQQNTLVHFENMRHCRIGAETCSALNSHGKSLTSLKLGLDGEGVQALAILQRCTAVETLELSSFTPSVDLKATQNDVYLEIISWLKDCKSLADMALYNFASAPDLLLPVLLNKDVSLQKLHINANEEAMYVVQDHHDFHLALSQQRSLRNLHLKGDPDPTSRDDIDTLMTALCSLKGLRVLSLSRISDYFTDERIKLLVQHLTNLEDLDIGGFGISDDSLSGLSTLKNLKVVTFSGLTTFSETGLMNFIDQLGDGNYGLSMSVDMADPESDKTLSSESQDRIRETLATKLDGRFEYQLLRDPNMDVFDEDDSD